MKLPPYLKYTIILFGIFLFFHVLVIARNLLIPFAISLLLALLLHPLCTRLEKIRFSRGTASIVSIVIIILVLSTIIYFMSVQIGKISQDLTQIGAKVNAIVDRSHRLMEDTFGIEEKEQTQYLKESLNNIFQNSSKFLTDTLSATAGFFTSVVLVILCLFFLLYYSNFFKAFFYRLVSDEKHAKLNHIFNNAKIVVQNYITGLFMVIGIVATLNTVGLTIIGIDYALFFGVLAALLTIIPYLGIFLGSLLPILFAFFTRDSLWYPVGVAAVFWFVQFIEGNFITPNVVGNKVSLNPFAAIIALFIGGAIWGAAGMILFVPFLALLKVIFDVIEPLQPYGFLLGNPDAKKENSKLARTIKKKLKRVKS